MPTGSQLLSLGVDSLQLDTTIQPGDDFDAYVNGIWRAANPIPADKSSWGVTTILHEQILEVPSA